MGKYFSDAVETALQYIYYDTRTRAVRGQQGLQLLMQASNAGDGDADCILARCLSGINYVWSGHRFPEDEEKAEFLIRRSVQRGSAIGAMVAMRSGMLKPNLEKQMPFTLKEAFEIVLEKAAAGDAFCQYTIGNSYFWWDFMRIQNKNKRDFPTHAAFQDYLRENISKCEDWFWKAFRGGMYLAGNNLFNYYRTGDEDLIPPQPEKMVTIHKTGAEIGYALHQYFHAQNLEEAGNMEEAVEWYRQAAQGGQPGIWYSLGKIYEEGKGVPQNLLEAVRCYEQSVANNEIGGYNRLADAYYFGRGVPQDFAKAIELFTYVYEVLDNSYGVTKLARCYLEGWGTFPDYEKAYALAWKYRGESDCLYILGRIYCEGLGRAKDIAKGVDFLQKAGNFPAAQEELKHYKKNLFGKWVRR